MPLLEGTSLKRKQTLVIMLVTGVALVLACAAFATYDVLTFRKTMISKVVTLAEIVGDNSAAAIDFQDSKSAEETLAQLKDDPYVMGAGIYDTHGKIFATYDRAGDSRATTLPPYQKDGHRFTHDSLQLFDPIDYHSEPIGTLYIEYDLNELYERLQRYAVITAGVFAISMLSGFLLAGRLQRLISEPILHLVQTARAVARDKDYSVRVNRHSKGEIGVLIDGFNDMLSQIQERDAV